MKLHLLIQMYQPASGPGLNRMLECLDRNLDLDFVGAVTVVCDRVDVPRQDPRIRRLNTTTRASFADMLRIAAVTASDQVSHFAIANADIRLTPDIGVLMRRVTAAHTVAAISRHELDGSLCPNPAWSQDVWLFKSHRPVAGLLDVCHYKLGIAGCENRFAMELFSQGYKLWNPCLDCRILHVDPEPSTSYTERYRGAYLYLSPCMTNDVEKQTPDYVTRINRGEFMEGSSPESLSLR